MGRPPAAEPDWLLPEFTPSARRRGQIGFALVVGAAVLAGVVLLPMIVTRFDTPEVREPGEWRFTHVVGSDRWPVIQRILDADHEYTMVTAPSGTTCVVRSSADGLSGDPSVHGRPVRIGPRPGFAVDGPEGPEIVWQYAPAAAAKARCFDDVAEATLIDLAEQVDFTDSRVRLPFLINALPSGFHVASIDERRGGAAVAVTLSPNQGLVMPSVIIAYGSDQPSNRCIDRSRGEVVCLTASWSTEDLPFAPSREQRALQAVEDHLSIVPDPAVRSTWFDAMDLPR